MFSKSQIEISNATSDARMSGRPNIFIRQIGERSAVFVVFIVFASVSLIPASSFHFSPDWMASSDSRSNQLFLRSRSYETGELCAVGRCADSSALGGSDSLGKLRPPVDGRSLDAE